MTNILVP